MLVQTDKENQELENFINEQHIKVFVEVYVNKVKNIVLFILMIVPVLITIHCFSIGLDKPEAIGMIK